MSSCTDSAESLLREAREYDFTPIFRGAIRQPESGQRVAQHGPSGGGTPCADTPTQPDIQNSEEKS